MPSQTTLGFEPAKLDFQAPGQEEPPAGQIPYDAAMTASKPRKLVNMINGIMNRIDTSDLATAPGIRSSSGDMNGDATFAVSQHLALIGAYEHNSRLSVDTMALGVAFTFGRSTN
jgi:hypothetical protein